ncbi:PQQ-binding-like beta-propeller repeat protein [Halobacillus sp. B23F22_1]|uniref:PQQ-binding-like beta-propeller repeat protein n=1 Tax=Halobacillus sp. B23F22_1 TaxID=3459514 RepID=UPI00373F9CA3
MYAYDLKSGERQWEYEDEVMKAPPVAKDNVVYFGNTKGLVQALDAESGEKQGELELGGTLAPSGPIIMNDTLIIGSPDSNFSVLTEHILDDEVETFESLVDSETEGRNDESSNQVIIKRAFRLPNKN